MKYLIVILVVAAGLWMLLRRRRREPPAAAARSAHRPAQAMVQCSHCGVHLPRAEALVSEDLTFCSEAHRLAGPRPT
jgi:uncharacterized protein